MQFGLILGIVVI